MKEFTKYLFFAVTLFFCKFSFSQSLLRSEIYDYEVGDNWIIRSRSSNKAPFYEHFYVLSKTIHSSDSISYQFKIKEYEFVSVELGYKTKDVYITLDYGSLNQPVFFDFKQKDTIIRDTLNNFEYISYILKDSVYNGFCNFLINERYESTYFNEHITEEKATKGIGVYKDIFGFIGNTYLIYEILYSEKGNDSCGSKSELPTSVFDISLQNISVYPNPTKDLIYINYSDFDTYSIYNCEGKLIEYSIINNQIVNVSSFENGVYFLSFYKDNQEVYRVKIVKIN